MNDHSMVNPTVRPARRLTFFVRARRTGFEVLMLAVVASGVAGCAAQSSASYDGAMTVTIENDTFTNSDNNYTNGIGATWVSNDLETYDSESFVRKWEKFWSFLPFVSDEGYQTYAAWSLAQEMHTPDDIEDPNPPEDDQPYAGILYVDSVLYARKERWAHAWELKLGVVGPASQAEEVQKKFHELISADEPLGWDTQLPNEPVINVSLTTAHLLGEGTSGRIGRVENRACGQRGARHLLHRRGTRHVRRSRLESRRRAGWYRPQRGAECSIDRRCRAGGWLVRVVLRRCGRLWRRPLPSTRWDGVQGQPLGRHGALDRYALIRGRGAPSQLRLELRRDILYRGFQNRAQECRVRDVERILVLLKGLSVRSTRLVHEDLDELSGAHDQSVGNPDLRHDQRAHDDRHEERGAGHRGEVAIHDQP